MQIQNRRYIAQKWWVLSAAVLAGIGWSAAGAATLNWDENQTLSSNSGTGGGTGTWDTTSSYWYNGTPPDQTWSNGSDAVFGGAAGTVTLDTNITANSLTFTSSGYTINDNAGDSGSLALTLTTGDVTVGSGLTNTVNTVITGTNGLTLLISNTVTGSTFNGGGTLILDPTVPETYTGNTTLLAGTLEVGANVLPTATAVAFGADTATSATTSATLDLLGNQMITNLSAFNQVPTSTVPAPATAPNVIYTIQIPSTNTLYITGSGTTTTIQIGSNNTLTETSVHTTVNFVGSALGAHDGGALVVGSTNGTSADSTAVSLQFGPSVQGTVNMGDLTSFTAFLGTLRIGDFAGAAGNDTSAIYLAPTSIVTAGTVRIGGDSSGDNQFGTGPGELQQGQPGYVESLFLGNIANTLNVVDIRVGAVGNISSTTENEVSPVTDAAYHDAGLLEFTGGEASGGTVTIHNSAGGTFPGADFFEIYGDLKNIYNPITSTVDFSGHSASIFLQTLVLADVVNGSSTTTAASETATFSFDPPANDNGFSELSILNYNAANGSGGLNTTGNGNVSGTGDSVVIGGRITTAIGATSATLNVGSQVATTPIILGVVVMATNTSSNHTNSSTGVFNISGGTVAIASIQEADASASNTSTGTVTITGGTVTMGPLSGSGQTLTAGSSVLTRFGGAGTENTTFTLNGGILEMSGYAIGSSAAPIGSGTGSLNFENGILEDLSELNGGSGSTHPLLAILTESTPGGVLTLTGNNTYTGGTAITAGTILANSPTGDSSTGSYYVIIYSGGVLAGTGYISNIASSSTPTSSEVIVNAGSGVPGGTISAGDGATSSNHAGLLHTFGGDTNNPPTNYSEVWTGGASGTGGAYAWKVNTSQTSNGTVTQSNGVGTTDPGGPGANWDMLAMTTLNVNASSSTPFNIQVVPLGGTSLSGSEYTIADITSGIVTVGATTYSGNSSATLASLQTALQAALNLTSSGTVSNLSSYSMGAVSDGASGDDIVINYAPVPEPTSLALLGLTAGGLLTRRSRRLRAAGAI